MIKIVEKVTYKLLGERIFYRLLGQFRNVQNRFGRQTLNKYLFILSPPYCGSTLLNQIISQSKHVSVNNPLHSREGQQLPEIKSMTYYFKRRWEPELPFDWKYRYSVWHKYWDRRKKILLEKSPANLVRAKQIPDYFNPSYFIIMVRNPYAHCEGLMRRNNWPAKRAAAHVMKTLYWQRENVNYLDNSLCVTYEELTTNTVKTVSRIQALLPELEEINTKRKFSAHNFQKKKMHIQNLNEQKIQKIKTDDLKQMNDVFAKQPEVLSFFGYKMI